MTGKSKFGPSAMFMIVLAACSAGNKSANRTNDSIGQGSTSFENKAAQVPKPSPANAMPMLTETDRLMLEQAEAACKNGDFRSYFEALLRSKTVRLRYFEQQIIAEGRSWLAEHYEFPFAIMDYNYVTSASLHKAPAEWEYVKLEFNEAQDERYSVDWIRIDFGANGNDESETPEDDKQYGPPGQLLFYPTKKCWTLAKDSIFK